MKKKMHSILLLGALAASAIGWGTSTVRASSHMDAPLITLDPAANTTDVYAFVTVRNQMKYLTTALAVYPFEEPGIGPNKYNFDDNVLYEIHVATGTNVAAGKASITYEFRFRTVYKNPGTILQSYLGVINDVDDAKQNLTQHYSVTKVVGSRRTVLFEDALVPPNNQGLVTPFYNQAVDGNNRAVEGVAAEAALDRYTGQSVFDCSRRYLVFAGQRDDGFYADIQSIFDLDFSFSGPNKPFDSQGGFNVHTIALSIPIEELGADQQTVGVWATTSRRRVTALRTNNTPQLVGQYIQVGRQGNPLFCEAFIPISDKDRYNRQTPARDALDFAKYALAPELAKVLLPNNPGKQTGRTDLAGIFIPDLIKVDLSTQAVRLAGGTNAGAAPSDPGFHRLSVFGGDTLASPLASGAQVAGGWPNGRRFGDDVLDIALLALFGDAYPGNPALADFDRVTQNDIGYNKVFPYAATPQNGRNHPHH